MPLEDTRTTRCVLDVLHILDALHPERKNLPETERLLVASLHHHILGDGHAALSWLAGVKTPESGELFLRALFFTDNIRELEDLFHNQLPYAHRWTAAQTRLWCQIWLFLHPNPELAKKALDATSWTSDLLEERIFTAQQLQSFDDLESYLTEGGLQENRVRLGILLGDLRERWQEAFRYFSRQNALETLIKIEYVCRANQDEDLFWATEMNLFSNIGESEFRDAVQFLHASRDREEIAIEQLMALSEHTNWARALAIRVAFSIAARHNEDATLLRLYYKMYQLARRPELKVACCLRAGMLAENRLKRFREAEEFYRVVLELDPANFLATRGLFRMLLARRAFAEIVDLGAQVEDAYIQRTAAFLAEFRLYNYKLALQLTVEQDIATRARLSAAMGHWEELDVLYAVEKPPVPETLAKLVRSIVAAMQSRYEDAVALANATRQDASLLADLLQAAWLQQTGDLDAAIEHLENAIKRVKEPQVQQTLYLQGTLWTMEHAPVTAAVWLGNYIARGGVIPEKGSTGRQWLELLMSHPNPDPKWFTSLAPTLEGLIEETEANRAWPKVAQLLNIKLLMMPPDAQRIGALIHLAQISEEYLSDIGRAITCYTEVLLYNAHHREALDSLARIYETAENWDEYLRVIRLSIDAYSKEIEKEKDVDKINSTLASLYFKYGSVLETKYNKVDDAIEYYKKSIEYNASSLPALHGLRDIYLRRENWNGVLRTLDMEAKIWDDDKEKAGIYTQMGNILMEKLGQQERAMRFFDAALAKRPDSPGALRSLFQLYFKQGAWEKASELAVSLGPKVLTEGSAVERAQLHYHRGMVFMHSGDRAEAARSFISALDLNPRQLEPLYKFIEIITQFENVFVAEEFITELDSIYANIKDLPEATALIYIARARLLVLQNHHQEALAMFRQARKTHPYLLDAVLGETRILLDLQEEEEAINTWNEFALALAKVEHSEFSQESIVKAHITMARFLSEYLGRNREALNTLRKFLEKVPGEPSILLELAAELFANNQVRESFVTLERLLSIARQNPTQQSHIQAFAAMLYSDAGEERKAAELLQTVDPMALRPQDALLYCYALAKQREFAKALNILKKVPISSIDDREEVALHNALLQLYAGNTTTAIEELEAISSQYTPAAELLVDVLVNLEEKRNIARHLDTLLPTHFDDVNYLQILENYLPPTSPRRRRIQLVRAMFDLEYPSPEPVRILRNGALAGEDFRNLVGVKDVTGPAAQLWTAIHTQLEETFSPVDPALSEARKAKGPELLTWEEIEVTLGQTAELWVADITSRPMLVFANQHGLQVVVQPQIFDFPLSTVQFLLARALEAARSGYNLFYLLTESQREAICKLMYAIALPPQERDETARKFVSSLERPAQKALERVSTASWDVFPQINLKEWMDSIDLALDTVGLILCGDPVSAFQGMAYLVNKHVQITDQVITNFVIAPRSEKLLQRFLSTKWDKFMDTIQ